MNINTHFSSLIQTSNSPGTEPVLLTETWSVPMLMDSKFSICTESNTPTALCLMNAMSSASTSSVIAVLCFSAIFRRSSD